MNDLGVSLHSHNELPTFRDAVAAANDRHGGLRFDHRYFDPAFAPGRGDSPVIGVKRTVPRYAYVGLSLILDHEHEFHGGVEDYGAIAADRLTRHIAENWDKSRPTLVLHSNGYDSRILSSCLARLRDSGTNLGTVHFRCHEPEGKHFLEIMRRQDWHPSQYSVFKDPDEDVFDVGHWDRPGTSAWLPVTTSANFWRDIVPYDEEPYWNLMTGIGGGESCEYPTLKKPPFVPWRFCENKPVQLWFSYFIDGTDYVGDIESRFAKALFPYFGALHIRTIAALPDRFLGYENGGDWTNACDLVRASILRQFKDPLLDLPRAPRTYRWSISARRWGEMHSNYAKSAFLREVPGAPAADDLIARMQATWFSQTDNSAERLWRLAALWEAVRNGGRS